MFLKNDKREDCIVYREKIVVYGLTAFASWWIFLTDYAVVL